MEIEEYNKMYKFEEHYWWWVGKRAIIKHLLDILKLDSINILDVGCGTGINLDFLQKYGNVFGVDFSKEAKKFCKMRGYKIIQANAEKLPLKENTFDLITALDLLEHLDDNMAISEFYRVLKPDGYLILTVPAFTFLWSKHDEALHHKRRYDKNQLKNVLKSNGFIIKKLSYWNFFLFFPIAIIRLIKKNMKNKTITSDVKEIPRIINDFLIFMLKIESYLISHINLPIGISLVCVGKVNKR
ncbi:MAG: class I SAM-dependent methyltransferase [Candidatus Atribacteria bacterium]|nr:class I SAM-dependent methyltransferase [Candidatus Atribacteria bacterium]